MKYHIHIPKLLEFALNVVCDDITLRGKQSLISPIPYPLYLRCIMTYADKYDRDRYSTYRFYRDIRRKADVDAQIGRLYPNVLDHIVLDDDDVDDELFVEVTQSPLVDDAAASIQRFASRCLAADKSEMMVMMISQVLIDYSAFPKPILDVLLFYGATLDEKDSGYFRRACLRGMNDDVQQAIKNGLNVAEHDVNAAIESGNCETINLVASAYRGSYELTSLNLFDATVQSLELCMSLGFVQCGTQYKFYNIPSFSVLQWILDHDVMEHDYVLIDIASNASYFSGHYFDMLRYLIEQRNFTVPRDILAKRRMEGYPISDLDVFDYLLLHGADLNAVDEDGKNVLERSPMLIRYWIDKETTVMKSNDANTMRQSVHQNMTAPVLEMMIDKYSININAVDRDGWTALHAACGYNNLEVVKMLLGHGADVNKRNHDGRTPYDLCRDDRIKQLLITFGYKPRS